MISENRRNPGNMGVLATGDFNNDGIGDIAMGSPRSAGFLTDESGNVFILFGFVHAGAPNAIDPIETYFDLTASPTVTGNPLNSLVAVEPALGAQIMPEYGGEWFGAALAAGDFDGDGIDDLAIGAPAPIGNAGPGRVYIQYGRADLGGTVEVDVEIFNDRASEIRGLAMSPRFGETLFMADIDQDGFDDLLISSRGVANEGLVYVVYGRDRNPPFPSWNLERRDVDDTVLLTQIIGTTPGERLGFSMAAGDLDLDGRLEVLLGAPYWPSVGVSQGRVLGYRGLVQALGFVNVDTYPAFTRIEGQVDGMQLGAALAYGENLYGPGNHALAMGAPRANMNNTGSVYVVQRTSLATTSTLTMPSGALSHFRGITANAGLGQTLGIGAYDSIPGPELVIGEPGWEPATFMLDTGRVFAFSGGPGLPTGVVDVTNPLYDSSRFEGFNAEFAAGSNIAFTNFDNYNLPGSEVDLVIGSSGQYIYDTTCNEPNDLGSWTLCHNAREGIRVFVIRSGSVPDPGVPTDAMPGAWNLLP